MEIVNYEFTCNPRLDHTFLLKIPNIFMYIKNWPSVLRLNMPCACLTLFPFTLSFLYTYKYIISLVILFFFFSIESHKMHWTVYEINESCFFHMPKQFHNSNPWISDKPSLGHGYIFFAIQYVIRTHTHSLFYNTFIYLVCLFVLGRDRE